MVDGGICTIIDFPFLGVGAKWGICGNSRIGDLRLFAKPETLWSPRIIEASRCGTVSGDRLRGRERIFVGDLFFENGGFLRLKDYCLGIF